MRSAIASPISEKTVIELWQRKVSLREHLVDSRGEPLQVIYPGRHNDGRGADFCDAVVVRTDGEKRGCIEIHSRASGWWTHGHHLDPNYNNVVLHVAYHGGAEAGIVTESGERIPTVILDNLPSVDPKRIQPGQSLPCRVKKTKAGSQRLARLLDQAGEARFQVKTAGFGSEMAEIEGGQSLYRGLMRALGYSKNTAPFLKLAGLVTLANLERIVQNDSGEPTALLKMQARLLGTAGLISQTVPPANIDPQYLQQLEAQWLFRPRKRLLNPLDWEFFRIRPGNHPVQRIMALSHILYRFRNEGLLQGCLNLIRGSCLATSARNLMAFSEVSSGSKAVYNFPDNIGTADGTLLGRVRASEIAVNVLLPFAWAWARKNGQSDLSRKTGEIYRNFPRLAANSIERHMLEQLALRRNEVNTARRQQGLLHIYKSFCTQGRCCDCPIVS